MSLATAAVIGLTSVQGAAAGGADERFCSATARLIQRACQHGVLDDYWTVLAACTNVSDAAKRLECLDAAKASRRDDDQLCREQLAGRLDACASLGEARYDPDVAPSLFDNPKNPTNPNSYFPLKVGSRWRYVGGGQVNTVEVVNETKLIEGVRCLVARDLVFENGALIEATDDWYAHAKDGSVWYFGEEVKDFESFAGDKPKRPELVDIEGHFKAGREGAKPGVIFLASPAPGDVYLEEFSLGNAEDVTEILSTTYSFGTHPELDRGVPQALANVLCSGDCVVTKNFSLLEPGVFARKYYARGIGVFLEVEVNPETSDVEVSQLVSCNVDARCVSLPTP